MQRGTNLFCRPSNKHRRSRVQAGQRQERRVLRSKSYLETPKKYLPACRGCGECPIGKNHDGHGRVSKEADWSWRTSPLLKAYARFAPKRGRARVQNAGCSGGFILVDGEENGICLREGRRFVPETGDILHRGE